MLSTLTLVLQMLSPLIVVILLLEAARWRDRRRDAAISRQIALTDALAEELGAVVAPVVRPAWWGPWRVHIAVPVSHPVLVGRVVAIAAAVLARVPGRHAIVLTPREPATPVVTRVPSIVPRPQAA